MWNDLTEIIQARILTTCLYLIGIVLIALAAVAVWPLVRNGWRQLRERGADKGLALFAVMMTLYGGAKLIPMELIGADAGIEIVSISADYDATNDVSAVEVNFTGNGVTIATPVSVRNAVTEQWRELVKSSATITSDLPTNILAFATAGNAATNRFWWVGTNTPPVVVTTEGITITNFVASSRSVHIAWTCEDPKATEFAIQRRRVKPASIPYDAEIEYLESSGTQYIDTCIYHNYTNAVRFKIRMPTHSPTVSWLGAYADYLDEQSRTTRIIRWQTSLTNVMIYHGAIAGQQGTGVNNVVGSDYIVEGYTTNTGGVLNGVSYTVSNAAAGVTGTAPKTMKLLTSNSNIANARTARVYYFKIDNQCDLQPVRVGGGASAVGYMYDRVTNQLLGNGGSGAFGLGGDTLSYDWETVATTEGGSFDYIGFTVGESWEWRIISTYTEGEE